MSDSQYTTERPLRVLSLGAGVQSTTLALMAHHGLIGEGPFHAAIFADTRAEPRYVYEQLNYLESVLSYPIIRVMQGDGLTADIHLGTQGKTTSNPPWFTLRDGKKGMLRRKCTSNFKIYPITRQVREMLGIGYYKHAPKEVVCHQHIGISLDEIIRCKESRYPYIKSVWPLVELKMTRQDCLDWLQENNYPIPRRSACTYCPYRPMPEWREMKEHDPESFAEAVKIDALIRKGTPGVNGEAFVHASRVPLSEIDFTEPPPEGQKEFAWLEECDGMCGH